MGVFSKILDKLGLKKEAKTQSSERRPSAGTSAKKPSQQQSFKESRRAAAGAPAKDDTEVTAVDVVSKLEKMAAKNPQNLNWKESIVDLLKLLDIDSSYEARKELATELGFPADKMDDSAQMNVWLHKTVLQKIADDGGNIPQELLD